MRIMLYSVVPSCIVFSTGVRLSAPERRLMVTLVIHQRTLLNVTSTLTHTGTHGVPCLSFSVCSVPLNDALPVCICVFGRLSPSFPSFVCNLRCCIVPVIGIFVYVYAFHIPSSLCSVLLCYVLESIPSAASLTDIRSLISPSSPSLYHLCDTLVHCYLLLPSPTLSHRHFGNRSPDGRSN